MGREKELFFGQRTHGVAALNEKYEKWLVRTLDL